MISTNSLEYVTSIISILYPFVNTLERKALFTFKMFLFNEHWTTFVQEMRVTCRHQSVFAPQESKENQHGGQRWGSMEGLGMCWTFLKRLL